MAELKNLVDIIEELERDFNETCVVIADEVASCNDPTQWLDLLTKLYKSPEEKVNTLKLSAKLTERLDSDLMPQLVQILLEKSYDLCAAENVNKFFRWTLTVISKCFKHGVQTRLSCLARILDPHQRFYLTYRTSINVIENQVSVNRFTVDESRDEYTSRYFLRNLEYWGQVGGFVGFLDVLKATGTSFETLQYILRIIYDSKDHFTTEFMTMYFPKLCDALGTLLRNLDPTQFFSLPRDSLLEVVQVLQLLVVNILHRVDTFDALTTNEQVTTIRSSNSEHWKDSVDACNGCVQLVQLEIFFRFFSSCSLEKRIYGLTEIVVTMTRLYNDQIQEQTEATAASLYATLSYLVDWMNEKQFMQELLGEKMHVELIKRSTTLFQFVSGLECLSTEWIDLIWKNYQADTDAISDEGNQPLHEAFQSTFHDLLLELVTFMDFSSLNHLLGRLEAVKTRFHSSQLEILLAIATRKLSVESSSGHNDADVASTDPSRQRSLRQRILMHLWETVLPSCKSDSFCDEVLLRMQEMLRIEVAVEDVEECSEETDRNWCFKKCLMVDDFLHLCIENISQRKSLTISLKLLAHLSSLIVEENVIVTTLNQGGSFIQILWKETKEYKQAIRQALESTNWRQLDDNERSKLAALTNHVDEIKNRLLALRAAWILDEVGDNKASSFTKEQMNNVWELMIIDAFLLDEAALCFQWIELCMNTPVQTRCSNVYNLSTSKSGAIFPLSIAEHLLTTKFSTVPGDRITLSTLSCFHSIFRCINVLNGGLELFATTGDPSSPIGKTDSICISGGDKDKVVELMTGQPLVGLDELWQLAVTVTDSTVAGELITLLANFHLAFTPNARETKLPIQHKMIFLEKCMQFIVKAKTDAESSCNNYIGNKSKLATSIAIVNRCVDLLRYFLEACRAGDESATKEAEEVMLLQLANDEMTNVDTSEENKNAGEEVFQPKNLEERLPYLEIYPSPVKVDSSSGRSDFRTGRRPSWTNGQLLGIFTDITAKDDDVDAAELDRQKEGKDGYSTVPVVPLSPQRGPDFRSEDIDQALIDFASTKDHQIRSSSSKNASTEVEQASEKYDIMSQILANKGMHFDVLLELVDWNDTTSQRTWDLICRLPTNNELLLKMICLRPRDKSQEAPVWSELLDGSNVHRLLYALRLVEALLLPMKDSVNNNHELNSGRRQWRERFVRLGGAKHLYETLLKWPTTHPKMAENSISSPYVLNTRATCLAAVLRVLNYFFEWNRRSALENAPGSSFDLRLQTSTLPEFLSSIDLSSILTAAVKETGSYCLQKAHNDVSFSDEAAEAVYCGVQMCCSLIRHSPHLMTKIFEAETDDGKASSVEFTCSRLTMSGWLKALLVDCPSKLTRAQVLGALSDIALTIKNIPNRELLEPLVVSAYYLVSDGLLMDVYDFSALEELFTFCQVLLSCYERADLMNTALLDDTNVNEPLALALMAKRIPGRLVNILGLIVSKRQTFMKTKDIRALRNQCEGMLRGYLNLLALLVGITDKIRSTILCNSPANQCVENASMSGEAMIRFVHNVLLYGDKNKDLDALSPPICKTSLARLSAQNFLLNLVFPTTLVTKKNSYGASSSNDEMCLFLLNQIEDYQARVLETIDVTGRQWNYSPADSILDPLTSTNKVGLLNPGCICYMNALVQQLFMTPLFCRGLLALECSQTSPDETKWKDEIEQLQRLFVSLAFTNYRSSDPSAFANAHKDMDGNVTDVHIQMDADEFFCLLLDRVEMFIRPKVSRNYLEIRAPGQPEPYRDFMAQCFGGILVNQILTQQGNLSEREEKFFALSLEVSKKRHLTGSLELYVQTETLEGENAYFCERVQRKVSATKRVCIKKLPQTLVCHLKRFKFDYDTMEKVKINDFLEFPLEVNMYPYTSEALASTRNESTNKSIMYDLVGVVVHSGTADTGHYYSFIKDRQGTGTQRPRWLEFNDEVIRDFDLETMDDECFGGEEVAQKWDTVQRCYSPIAQMKQRSAYMLFYEKRLTEDNSCLKEEMTNPVTFSSQVDAFSRQIMQENARYESVVNAFDPAYEQFIGSLMKKMTRLAEDSSPAVTRMACQLSCQYLLGISSLRRRTATNKSTVDFDECKISSHVVSWLSGYKGTTCSDERVQFSKWVLEKVVAPPKTSTATSTATPSVESKRTWLFDILFLPSGSLKLAENCFELLFAAVKILAREASNKAKDAKKSLVVFFREALNLFYSRETHLGVRDLASGSILTLSMDTRAKALKNLGVFLVKCINESMGDGTQSCKKQISAEISILHCLFLENLHFLDRFLMTLQTPCATLNAVINSQVSRKKKPLGIETRVGAPMCEQDLRLSTICLEIKLFKRLLESYENPGSLPLTTTLLMNHSVLKNVVLFDLEEIVASILVRTIFQSETVALQCDRLVTLLIGVLEDVKETYATKVLTILTKILDEEEEKLKNSKDIQSSTSWIAHEHIFSPSRGILHCLTKDHVSHDYALVLVKFVVDRAFTSSVLREIFQKNSKFHNSVSWISKWLVTHLGPNGAVRRCSGRRSSLDATIEQDIEEIRALFVKVKKAFYQIIPAYCSDKLEEGHRLMDAPSSSMSCVTVEKVMLHLENQEDVRSDSVSMKHGNSQLLDRIITNDLGSANARERRQCDWKLHRSREDHSMLLPINLDTRHTSAREA